MRSRARPGFILASVGLLAGTLIWRKRESANVWLTNLGELFREPRYLLGGLETPEDILDYLWDHRSDVALVCYSANGDDGGAGGAAVVSHNADEPMPLASTMKIVVLTAYAQEVVVGRLDPGEPVHFRDWEKYYLPGTDGGAHVEALKRLGLSSAGTSDPDRALDTVTLDEVVRTMIQESDNAATDYVLDLVGDEAINSAIENAGMRGQESISSLLGEVLSISNHESPTLTDEKLEALLLLSPEEYWRTTEEMARKYLDTPWGEAERRFIGSERPPERLGNETIAYHRLTPKGTAGDYARVMAQVVRGELVSSEVSRIMRSHLEWPMQEPANRERFLALGAKGGSLPGILTEAWYLIPISGDFAEQPRVVALFMRRMPLSAWSRMGKTYVQQEFALQVATDREFAALVERTMSRFASGSAFGQKKQTKHSSQIIRLMLRLVIQANRKPKRGDEAWISFASICRAEWRNTSRA